VEVLDSRRLTGPNIVTAGPGAILDIVVEEGEETEPVVAAWTRQVERILEAVGWGGTEPVHRIFPGGMSLAFHAPIDALYAATEVNEWAWQAAEAELAGEEASDFDAASERLRGEIAGEVKPLVLALEAAAAERGVAFLWDDDRVSIGLGRGSRTWGVEEIPDPSSVDWKRIRDVPIAQVTGTNGKTTTVRLLAAMVEAAGLTPGVSSTDWIAVGDEILDHGDYSGPGGARQVLRDRRTQTAILETARGGMLRRGLAVERTDVAAVLNVAEDHLGEFGVHDLDALARCKFIVDRAAQRLVLNADDPVVRRHGEGTRRPIIWFSLHPDDPFVIAHLAAGGDACLLERGRLVLHRRGRRLAMAEVAEVPLTLGGAARYNIANALAAVAVAAELGLQPKAIGAGLRRFESTPETNPGRLNEFSIDGARVIVDFAHNPHGVTALLETAAALPAERRLVTIGQAGDRDDASILQLARATWSAGPDRVLVKAMSEYLRGRQEGETQSMIEAELRTLGADDSHLVRTGDELDTARTALAWARPGDLILLIVHSHRDEVVAYLQKQESES